MNILVCMKLVSQAHFTDLLNNREDRLSGGDLSINPADLYALELALRIKEIQAGTMVTVMTMAPAYAEQSLRDALAMGADQAVLISDPCIAGSDTIVTARILTAAIRKLPDQDLILCGKKALDSETGHIGPQLSVFLSYPLSANVVSFSVENNEIEILRAADSGLYRYRNSLPVILTICNGNEMIRKPTIAGLRSSKGKEILVFHLSDLGMVPEEVGKVGSPTKTVSVENIRFHLADNVSIQDESEGTDAIIALLKAEKVSDNG